MLNAKLVVTLTVWAVGLLIVVAGASIVGVNPLEARITAVPAPVVLEPGRNAGAWDLSGSINVSVDSSGTRADIVVHPTYQFTLYLGVLNITNNDTRSYNVTFLVENPAAINGGGFALLYLEYYNETANRTEFVFAANLSREGAYGPIEIPAGRTYELTILVYAPEGYPLSNTTATLLIAYTPLNETAPEPP